MAVGTKLRASRMQAVLSLAVIFLVVVTGSCGGKAANDTTPVPQASTPVASSGPGTITIESRSPIVGQQGKLLVVFATPKNGAIPIARGCARITSDRFDVPATVMTDIGGSQEACGSTAATTFPKGTYTLAAGIYGPPYSNPEKESSLTVDHTGDGSVHVKVDGASLSR